jgi:hypothetical protein
MWVLMRQRYACSAAMKVKPDGNDCFNTGVCRASNHCLSIGVEAVPLEMRMAVYEHTVAFRLVPQKGSGRT